MKLESYSSKAYPCFIPYHTGNVMC